VLDQAKEAEYVRSIQGFCSKVQQRRFLGYERVMNYSPDETLIATVK